MPCYYSTTEDVLSEVRMVRTLYTSKFFCGTKNTQLQTSDKIWPNVMYQQLAIITNYEII